MKTLIKLLPVILLFFNGALAVAQEKQEKYIETVEKESMLYSEKMEMQLKMKNQRADLLNEKIKLQNQKANLLSSSQKKETAGKSSPELDKINKDIKSNEDKIKQLDAKLMKEK